MRQVKVYGEGIPDSGILIEVEDDDTMDEIRQKAILKSLEISSQ